MFVEGRDKPGSEPRPIDAVAFARRFGGIDHAAEAIRHRTKATAAVQEAAEHLIAARSLGEAALQSRSRDTITKLLAESAEHHVESDAMKALAQHHLAEAARHAKKALAGGELPCEVWTCENPSHLHRTKRAAQTCIDASN